jgi:hypothetical protein
MISEKELSDYLDTQSDFDLELFVLRSLRENGVSASHAGTYVDPVTATFRQYDVRASHVITPHKNIACQVAMAIECKALSEDRPLVLSCVRGSPADSIQQVIHSYGEPKNRASTTRVLSSEAQVRLYPENRRIGKKTDQVLRSDGKPLAKMRDNESFQKWSQALSSAEDLIKEGVGSNIRLARWNALTLVLPVLVISDNSLWVVDYDRHDRRRAPELVAQAELFVDRPYVLAESGIEYKIGNLHIYTRSGFAHFVARTLRSEDFAERAFGFAIRSILG